MSDGNPSTEEFRRAIVEGFIVGVPGVFVVTLAVALLAGVSGGAALVIAVLLGAVVGGTVGALWRVSKLRHRPDGGQ